MGKRVKLGIAIASAVALVALVVSQIAIPPIAEQRIGDRLTENGGEAEVEVSALPAAGLLLGLGGSLDVSARELSFDVFPEEDEDVMKRLDRFDEVDIEVTDSTAGPVEIESLALTREGDGTYRLIGTAATTPTDLIGFGAAQFGLAGLAIAGAAGQIVGDAVDPDTPIPIELDMLVESDEGRVEVTEGSSSVAGIPTGPLGRFITAAIVSRL